MLGNGRTIQCYTKSIIQGIGLTQWYLSALLGTFKMIRVKCESIGKLISYATKYLRQKSTHVDKSMTELS